MAFRGLEINIYWAGASLNRLAFTLNGNYVQVDSGILPIGTPLKFSGLDVALLTSFTEGETYYVVNHHPSSGYSVSATLGGSAVDIVTDAANGYHGWATKNETNFGDACFKPKLTKDQLSRKLVSFAQQYKKPLPADKLKTGVTFDTVTGTLIMGREESSVF